MTTSYVDIVFDGPPSHESGRFIEVENDKGASINFGEWVHRPDGFWALRIGAPISGEPPGRKKTSLDEDFGEYVLRNLMLACSHWSSSRNVDGTMNIAESELAAAFEARAREGIKELAATISGERVREACAKDCDEAAAIWRGLNPKDFPFAAIRKEECEARAKSIRALPLTAIKGEQARSLSERNAEMCVQRCGKTCAAYPACRCAAIKGDTNE